MQRRRGGATGGQQRLGSVAALPLLGALHALATGIWNPKPLNPNLGAKTGDLSRAKGNNRCLLYQTASDITVL